MHKARDLKHKNHEGVFESLCLLLAERASAVNPFGGQTKAISSEGGFLALVELFSPHFFLMVFFTP